MVTYLTRSASNLNHTTTMSDDLIGFEAIGPRLGCSKATLLRLSRMGKFPPYARALPHSPPMWDASAVSNWFRNAFRPLQDNQRHALQDAA